MIKLTEYTQYGKKEFFILKTMLYRMERNGSATNITFENGGVCTVQETPEEILAMLGIGEDNKVIDWEQRRYEIAKDITAAIYTRPNVKGTLLNYNQIVAAADGLIRELKKETEQ